MAYSPTVYVNGSAPAVSAENLNKSEQELLDLDMFSSNDRQYVGKELFKKGTAIGESGTANNYIITKTGVTSNNTRLVKTYPISNKPLYVKSQDGVQYRSAISASGTINTILEEIDGIVYPIPNATYIAISYEKNASGYGVWSVTNDIEITSEKTIENSNAIIEGGEYFTEVVGTSSSTSLYKDRLMDLSSGDCVVLNLNEITGANWSKAEVYVYDSQDNYTKVFETDSLGSYLIKINGNYVKIRVRVPVTNPTTPKLKYSIYKSDLKTLSGSIAYLRNALSDLVIPDNVLIGAKVNCLGDSFTDDSTSWEHVLAARISGLSTVHVAKGGSAIVTDYSSESLDAPSFLSRIDGTAPKPGGGYYTGLDTTANITVIFGGINDCRDLGSGDITMGTIDSTHDATTFFGGMQLLLDRIIDMIPEQFIIGVIPPTFSPVTPYTTYIAQIQEAERAIYRKYHIPYIDLAFDCFAMSDNSNITPIYRKSTTAPTNYHPNALGQKKICDLIQGKLQNMYRDDN